MPNSTSSIGGFVQDTAILRELISRDRISNKICCYTTGERKTWRPRTSEFPMFEAARQRSEHISEESGYTSYILV